MSRQVVITGSGPNGLVAGIQLLRAGYSVEIREACSTIGGGMRTRELTLPGFLHDVCSAIHPMALWSPILQQLPLADYGLSWIHPEIPLAHAYTADHAVCMYQSLEDTAEALGDDADSYKNLFKPLIQDESFLAHDVLSPLRWPQHPLTMARFGIHAGLPATWLVRRFRNPSTKALFAGNAAHAVQPLQHIVTSAVGILLSVIGHRHGWPLAKGGSQSIANALASYFQSLGGIIVTNSPTRSLNDLPADSIKLFDVSPRSLARIVGDGFSSRYQKRLLRYRHGPGVFKIDWALSGPIPWKSEQPHKTGTVHIGGSIEEINDWENGCWTGRLGKKPFVLLSQQSLFDTSRAPTGCHTGWAYCHVPNGSTLDMTEILENRIEEFAPGFRKRILSRHTMNTSDMEAYNANYIGGDVIGGMQNLSQIYARPVSMLSPYATERKDVFICSASTPPGGGVHGMCGYHAAQAVIRAFPI
jgi:phytoene dehydrogenase-like protein